MNSISRNLFMALTAVCAVALVVFFVQLIYINSGTEPKEPDSVIIGDISLPQDGEQSGETGAENPFEGYEPPPPTQRPPPEGTKRDIPVDVSGTILTIYADDAKFDYTESDVGWRFDYRGGGSAALEITHVFLSPQGIGDGAESFLNQQTGGDNAEYKGQQPIIDSDLSGYSVQAKTGGITHEAWLYRLPDNELALAFLINYEFTDQRDDLYEVLSSMSIEQG